MHYRTHDVGFIWPVILTLKSIVVFLNPLNLLFVLSKYQTVHETHHNHVEKIQCFQFHRRHY